MVAAWKAARTTFLVMVFTPSIEGTVDDIDVDVPHDTAALERELAKLNATVDAKIVEKKKKKKLDVGTHTSSYTLLGGLSGVGGWNMDWYGSKDQGWGKEEGWSCEPCWQRYLERHKQWYLDASPSVRCSSCGVREEDSSGWMGDGDWHCEGCWRAWFTKQGFEEWYKWNIERWYAQRDGHLDFIEIGTSNYSTITQTCAGHHDGKKGMWNLLPEDKSLRCMRGLAVDMQQQYLRQLPQLPHVAKVCAAVSEFDGTKLMEDVPARRGLSAGRPSSCATATGGATGRFSWLGAAAPSASTACCGRSWARSGCGTCSAGGAWLCGPCPRS
ncbi:unnamed protein product [Prorocentrum cordatum]|uniref:Uncharacterized protein n=1 Tax=Prorocentrum cordatum TaxID=2364126 RepID=A0ABN9VM52_9DINO|nr:unnamed protein product [Polarella glacialis]